MRRLILTLALGVVGVAMLLAGLGVDAYLHAQDGTLAAREGVFSLGNPGHLLLALGMALMCGSIFGAIYVAWGLSRTNGILNSRWLRLVTMQVAGLASLVAIGFAVASSGTRHDHGNPGTAEASAAHEDAHTLEATLAPMAGAAASVDPTAPLAAAGADPVDAAGDALHGHAPSRTADTASGDAGSLLAGGAAPVVEPARAHHSAERGAEAMMDAVAGDAMVLAESPAHEHEMDSAAAGTANTHPQNHPMPSAEELACLSDLTAHARELTARLADYDAALTEGYRLPRREGGTHYSNPAYQRDGDVFDLAHPESAIYRTRDDGTRVLVGVLYTAPVGQGSTPCGNATWWHTHPSCVDLTTRERIDAGREGACPDGTIFREGRVEMLHLWFVPRRG